MCIRDSVTTLWTGGGYGARSSPRVMAGWRGSLGGGPIRRHASRRRSGTIRASLVRRHSYADGHESGRESPEAKRAGGALLRGTTPVAQDTPAEQDRILELGLVVADVHGDLHGLDDALGCRLDSLNLVVLWVEEEPNDLRLRGGSRLRDGLLQNHVTSRGRSRRLGRVQDADVEGFADGVRLRFLARWHVSTY